MPRDGAISPVRVSVALLSILVAAALGPTGTSAGDAGSLGVYVAGELDQQGKLAEALPLYRSRAEETGTQADRLRYATALLRAGQREAAEAVLGELRRKDTHGESDAVVASSLLAAGFPALAVPHARAAHEAAPRDPGRTLLLVRALTAAGDRESARALIAKTRGEAARWADGERLELARWQIRMGDVRPARTLLDREPPEVVGQMFRDSIRADVALGQRDWPAVSELLGRAERRVPAGLTGKRVARAWRNVQRELYSVQLRRALALWREGPRDRAVPEARSAQASDEEYVRSAAILLLAVSDFAGGRRAEALARLDALAGHDHRFAEPVAHLRKALAGDAKEDPVAPFKAALAAEDRSLDFVTAPLVESLRESLVTP